jgi:hypothetical protein
MRRRVGAEEAKVVIQRIPNKAKKKNSRAALSAFLSHDGWTTIVSLLLSFVC